MEQATSDFAAVFKRLQPANVLADIAGAWNLHNVLKDGHRTTPIGDYK